MLFRITVVLIATLVVAMLMLAVGDVITGLAEALTNAG